MIMVATVISKVTMSVPCIRIPGSSGSGRAPSSRSTELTTLYAKRKSPLLVPTLVALRHPRPPRTVCRHHPRSEQAGIRLWRIDTSMPVLRGGGFDPLDQMPIDVARRPDGIS